MRTQRPSSSQTSASSLIGESDRIVIVEMWLGNLYFLGSYSELSTGSLNWRFTNQEVTPSTSLDGSRLLLQSVTSVSACATVIRFSPSSAYNLTISARRLAGRRTWLSNPFRSVAGMPACSVGHEGKNDPRRRPVRDGTMPDDSQFQQIRDDRADHRHASWKVTASHRVDGST